MQVLPVNLHVTPALNVMIIVEVSWSARNSATLENYSFFTLFEDANAKNECKRNPGLSLFLPKGNSASSESTLTGLHGFFAYPFHCNTCKTKWS